jgi:YfiH family protein
MRHPQFLVPDWPAPAHVHAACSLRAGGFSQGAYAGFNLGAHVGDDAHNVSENRRLLMEALSLPRQPLWLNQVHGADVVRCDGLSVSPQGDAAYSDEGGQVCAVLTADCLPVLFCNRAGTRIAAAHAGWRGLAAGVLEAAVYALQCPAEDVLAWMGPAIGPDAFEVGDEVRQIFLQKDASCRTCFLPSPADRWLADIYGLARLALKNCGVAAVYGGNFCTYQVSARFFSFRRVRDTGRMASLIWLE